MPLLERIRYRKDLLKGIGIVIGSLLVLFLLLNGIFYFSSYHPSTCKVCHIMVPYYRQWHTSTHKEFPCIKCHSYKWTNVFTYTTKYLTGIYSPKPHSIIDDSSCTKKGCHFPEPPEKMLFKKKFQFNHQIHNKSFLRIERLRCSNCHSQIVQGEHIRVSEDICFLCHFKGIEQGQAISGCTSCHGPPEKPVEHEGFFFSHESYLKIGVNCNQCHIEVREGTGNVPEDRCFNCHVERKKIDLEKLHFVHVYEKNYSCFSCHEKIKHGIIKLPGALETKCETCHKKLHSPQKEMYMGVGGKGVPDTPSRMFAAQVRCDGCHIKPVEEKEAKAISGIKSLAAEKKACVDCHGPGYDLMLDDWIREIDYALKFVEKQFNEFKARTKFLPPNKIGKDAVVLVEDAEKNINLVKEGKGAHNVEYAVKLLSSALDALDISGKFLFSGFKELPRPPLLSRQDSYCTRLCHSRIGIKDKVFFSEMKIDFPHLQHISSLKIPCTECHSPDKHKMRIITKDGCLSCHHKGGEETCKKCHIYQVKLYRGEVEGFERKPDPMFEGGVECLSCHDIKSGPLDIRDIRNKCVECHDETYSKLLADWMDSLLKIDSEISFSIASIEEKIETNRKFGKKVEKSLEGKIQEVKKMSNYISIARGVHNYELAKAIAERIKLLLKECEEKIGK